KGKQIFGLSDFRSCMALKTESRIGNAHALPIINNLDQRFSGIFDNQFYVGGFRINSIFEQFFYHRRRTLHNFSGSNLIGNMIWQQLNYTRHLAFLKVAQSYIINKRIEKSTSVK